MRQMLYRMFSLGLVLSSALFSGGCERNCDSCSPASPEQPAAVCTFSVTPLNQNFAYTGGMGNIAVATQNGCTWMAGSNVPWIVTTAVGNTSVSYTVIANNGGQRTGTLTIAGRTVTVTQDACPPPPPCTGSCNPTPPQPTPPPAPSCTYAVQETPQDFTYQGGNGGFSVSASAGTCPWTATSNVGWIAITGGSPGAGNGRVSYIVAGNGGGARTGTISVAAPERRKPCTRRPRSPCSV